MCASDAVVTSNTLLRLLANATILYCFIRAVPALKSMWNVTRESLRQDAIGYDLKLNATTLLLPLFFHTLGSSRHSFIRSQSVDAVCWRFEIKTQKSTFFVGSQSSCLWLKKEKWNATLYNCRQFKIHKFFVFIFVFGSSFCQLTRTTYYKICKFPFSTKRNHFWKFVCQTAIPRALEPPSPRPSGKQNRKMLVELKKLQLMSRNAFNLNIVFRCPQRLWACLRFG